MEYDNRGYYREKDERPTTLEMQNEPPPPYPTRNYGQVPPNQTIVVVQRQLADLGVTPATIHCNTCNMNVTTVVDDSMRDLGWIWCLLCSCFFSWIVGCLACCLNGFKKFTHKCPKCNCVIGVTEPAFTKREVSTIVFIKLLEIKKYFF